MKVKSYYLLIALAIAVFTSGCTPFIAGAAAGGTAAYLMRDDGYKVQSPVTKE